MGIAPLPSSMKASLDPVLNNRFFQLLGAICLATFALQAESKAGVDEAVEVFDAVWHQVNKAYYDPTFGGRDWVSIGERYRGELPNIASVGELRILLTRMLNELGESHFAIVPGSYDGSAPRRWFGGDLGMRTSIVKNRSVVMTVKEGGPAWRAGVQPGYLIQTIGDVSVEQLRKETLNAGFPAGTLPAFWHNQIESHLGVEPGEEIQLKLKTSAFNAKRVTIKSERYDGLMSEPFGHIPALPLEFASEIGEDGVAYLRFNLWFPAIMENIKRFLTSLEGKANGLIIDLRGNAGGIGLMATGISGLISEDEFTLGRMSMRQGYVNLIAYPQPRAFTGPVAVLIDRLSLSTTEIFAAGMKESGRARLFGEKTGGAALPSGFIDLPNGDKLQMAFANYITDEGNRLEGVGVAPDEEIILEPRLLRKGIDPVRSSAKMWLLARN